MAVLSSGSGVGPSDEEGSSSESGKRISSKCLSFFPVFICGLSEHSFTVLKSSFSLCHRQVMWT